MRLIVTAAVFYNPQLCAAPQGLPGCLDMLLELTTQDRANVLLIYEPVAACN